jgi:hypothetical protein
MNTIFKSVLLAFVLLPTLGIAQNANVDAALQGGNASGITPYLAKSVDVLVMGDESTVSPQQATTLLADFFTKASVKGYRQNHTSAAQNGKSTYSIGDLTTGSGIYRVTIMYDVTKKISEIRIEK